MKKNALKLLSLVLIASLLLGLLPVQAKASADNIGFADVNRWDWYYEAVRYVHEKGLMNGTSATTFSPGGQMTRGMAVTVLYRMEKTPFVWGGKTFSDISDDAWYKDAVLWAQKKGIITGYEDGTFRPDSAMTRQEMVAVMQRYAAWKGVNVSPAADLSVYTDHAAIQDYARPAVGWALAVGLIEGFPDNTVCPAAYASRAQLATVLMRLSTLVNPDARTVTFEANAPDVTGMPAIQYIAPGSRAAYPGVPEREGYAFGGWYLDPAETDLHKQYDFTTVLTDSITLYARWIDTGRDTDSDGIPDELESGLGCSPLNADTDGDGLNDYTEVIILGTDPARADTDGDGISDSGEDADQDGLTNGDEAIRSTSLVMPDTDLDGLQDREELFGTRYVTDPLREDTDGDGALDLWEIEHGFDPTAADKSFRTTAQASAGTVSVQVVTEVSGGKAMTLAVEPVVDHPILNTSIPGYIDVPFEFTVEDNLQGASATISFTLDSAAVSPDCDPAIYYYDDATQLLQELPTQVSGNVVSATVDHFSTYILLNRTLFDQVWETQLRPPVSTDGQDSFVDLVFVVDSSSSMNAYRRLITAKEAIHSFLDELSDKDRVALVQFSSYARTLSRLTSDKSAVGGIVDTIAAGGTTAMYTGFSEALELLTDPEESYGYKMIVILSDGRDEPSTSFMFKYAHLVDAAVDNNIVVYTIGAGNSVDTDMLRMVAETTGGAYYTASAAAGITDAFDHIQTEAIDLVTDTDGDGLPDYYESRLTTGGGVPLNLNINEPDCDMDGLADGEEVVLTESKDGRIYGVLLSDPNSYDTDMDGYSDGREVFSYKSDPCDKNVSFLEYHVDYLSNDDGFVSNDFLEHFETHASSRFWADVGNKAFGSNYDKSFLYKAALMSYLEDMCSAFEEKDDLLEELSFAQKFLAAANDQVDAALTFAQGDNIQYLRNLKQQMRVCDKNLSELVNSNLLDSGYTRKQVETLFSDMTKDYLDTSKKVEDLETKIRFNTKLKNASESFGLVMDVADIALSGVDVMSAYSSFASDMNGMQRCLDLLAVIAAERDAEPELRSAARELHRAIQDQHQMNMDALWDTFVAASGTGLTIWLTAAAIDKLPVVGKYILIAKAGMGLLDFMFNISDVSQEVSRLYAISKSAQIIAEEFSGLMSYAHYNNDWVILYGQRKDAADLYLALAVLRESSENQMWDADTANSFLLEWYYTDIAYKVSEIQENLGTLEKIKYQYCFVTGD